MIIIIIIIMIIIIIIIIIIINENNRNFSATFRHLRRQLFGNSSANLWLSHKQATDLEPSTASSKK